MCLVAALKKKQKMIATTYHCLHYPIVCCWCYSEVLQVRGRLAGKLVFIIIKGLLRYRHKSYSDSRKEKKADLLGAAVKIKQKK